MADCRRLANSADVAQNDTLRAVAGATSSSCSAGSTAWIRAWQSGRTPPSTSSRPGSSLTVAAPARRGDRGWNYAEVTAGGVPLSEIDSRTMESRKVPGLYLIGEILDCDGRIGGFNFQWAWSTGYLAAGGRGLCRVDGHLGRIV